MCFNHFLTLPQYLLPQHVLSRLLGKLANCKTPFIKNALIRLVIRHYHVNMTDALEQDITAYPTFNAFFTRALKPAIRPLPSHADSIVSPADGAISQLGTIQSGRIFQAKGHDFSVAELLGGTAESQPFINGSFATIYLAPKDYHRVHMPYTGKLIKMTYIPGRLFSVNTRTASTVPQLFARNERVICWFETDLGPMVVVFVGAFFVASIVTVWHGVVAPGASRKITQWTYDPKSPIFKIGDELGHFQFGSTVIVLFPEKTAQWQANITSGATVKMGQLLGQSCPHAS